MDKSLEFVVANLERDKGYTIKHIIEAIQEESLCDFISYAKLFDTKNPTFTGGVVKLHKPTMKLISILKVRNTVSIPFSEFQHSAFELSFKSSGVGLMSLECDFLELGVFVDKNVFMPRTFIREGTLLFDFTKRKGIYEML